MRPQTAGLPGGRPTRAQTPEAPCARRREIVIESPRMSDSLTAETIRIAGHGGDEIEAYLARPAE